MDEMNDPFDTERDRRPLDRRELTPTRLGELIGMSSLLLLAVLGGIYAIIWFVRTVF